MVFREAEVGEGGGVSSEAGNGEGLCSISIGRGLAWAVAIPMEAISLGDGVGEGGLTSGAEQAKNNGNRKY